MRNGVAITGTWSRASLTTPSTFTATDGAPMTLQPGDTWVELVPAGIPVTAGGGTHCRGHRATTRARTKTT